MKQKISVIIFIMLLMILGACSPSEDNIPTETPTEVEPTPSEPDITIELTEITISGLEEAIIGFDEPFNIFTGVIALGNDGIDYTDLITLTTVAPIDDQGNLDTTQIGRYAVRYNLNVSDIRLQRLRYITVLAPVRPEGMLINGDFEQGVLFWNNAANGYFVANGAALTLSIDNGALKAESIAGTDAWTPRFGQQNIPFEMGKTYQITFEAKSSVEKTIHLQVGELLSGAPWFINFKSGQDEYRTITTEWETYSYTFTMNLDNPRGGILFELGNINPEGQLDATIWFDNIRIDEVEND